MPSTSTVQYVALVAAGALACMPGMRACGGDVVSQNFDHYSGGWQPWIKTMAKEDFPRDADGNYGLIFLKDDTLQDVGEGMLRVRNPQGCVGTTGCGATFDVRLPPLEEATLSYRFMHSAGYIYGLGGKLPGMCAFDCPAGCMDVTPNSGFNARIMWRGDQLMSYSYFAGMPPETNCGENWYWDSTTSSGTWHTIEMYLKINTDGQANGVQRIKYDGTEVYARNDIKWTQGYHPIEKLTFRSFHGGGSPNWASEQEQFIYFDDIQVSSSQCGFGDFSPIMPDPPLTNGRVPPSTDPGGIAGALPAAPLPDGTPLPAPNFNPPMDPPTETPADGTFTPSSPTEPFIPTPPVDPPMDPTSPMDPPMGPIPPMDSTSPVDPIPPMDPPMDPIPPMDPPMDSTSPVDPIPPMDPPMDPIPPREPPATSAFPTDPPVTPSTDDVECGTFWKPVCDTEPPCESGLAPVYHVQLGGKAVCFPQFSPPSEDAARTPSSTPTATPGVDATTTTTGSASSPSPPTTPPPPTVFDTDDSAPLLVEQKEEDSDDDDDEFGDDDSAPAVPQSSGGRTRECTPIPGFYCSESNRLRKIKERSRKPRRARKE